VYFFEPMVSRVANWQRENSLAEHVAHGENHGASGGRLVAERGTQAGLGAAVGHCQDAGGLLGAGGQQREAADAVYGKLAGSQADGGPFTLLTMMLSRR
jgi:hypothetical protein